uniref:Uncharacterized protein n=1 Tax=Setaria italica TaxID=4555 RepID=K3ZPT8_SETIT
MNKYKPFSAGTHNNQKNYEQTFIESSNQGKIQVLTSFRPRETKGNRS